jgi:spore coat protein U-like protein
VTPARSLLIAMVAVVLVIGARPTAGDEQFPRGLMSAEPRGGAGGSCTIETRPLSFGAYDPLAETEVDAIGQIIYACSSGSGGSGGSGGGGDGRGGGPPPGRAGGLGTLAQNKGIRIELDQGSSNSFAPRSMVGPDFVSRLEYNIYLDATHRTVWGTGAGSTEVYIDLNPPIGTPVTVTAYGRIFGRQDVVAGQYTDSVAVRIQF